MIDLEPTEACFGWTYDKFSQLDEERELLEFGDGVWRTYKIESYVIGDDFVTFDAPPTAEWGDYTLRFDRSKDGSYRYEEEGETYSAVRGETADCVFLVGSWIQADYGRGSFFLSLPQRHRLS